MRTGPDRSTAAWNMLGVDAPPSEQHDCLALDEGLQVAPVDPGNLLHLRVLRFAVIADAAAVVGGRLRDRGLASRLLDPIAGAVRVLLSHGQS